MCLFSGLKWNAKLVERRSRCCSSSKAAVSKNTTCGSGNSGSCRLCDTYARTPTENALCWTAVFAHQDPPCNIQKILQSLSLFCSHGAIISGKKKKKRISLRITRVILHVLTASGQNTFCTHVTQSWGRCGLFAERDATVYLHRQPQISCIFQRCVFEYVNFFLQRLCLHLHSNQFFVPSHTSLTPNTPLQ